MTKSELQHQKQEYEQQTSISYPSFSLSLYGELIKSKQTFLLVYTTVFAYLISSWPNSFALNTFLWVIISLILAVSGSTLLNMYIDRDIDAKMERTKNRALPSGKISPITVRKHGIIFVITGIIAAGIFVNLLTMLIVFLGFFFDVVIYSIMLKRQTKYSIFVGGIAGGLPAIAGRTAVLGEIDIIAVLMGLFVLCWIPLHILTLALIPKNLEGYRNAGVPMWPVMSSQNQTIRVISISALMSAISILLTGILLQINVLILIPIIGLSIYILFKSLSNLYSPSERKTFIIFKLATIYMAFAFLWLFIGIIITDIL